MKITKKGQLLLCAIRSHWRAVVLTLLLTLFHLFCVQIYNQTYQLPTYNQTQQEYSDSVRAFLSYELEPRIDVEQVNGSRRAVFANDCLNYIFDDSFEKQALKQHCQRRMASSTDRWEYFLISTLLSDPAHFPIKTKQQIGESIVSGVKLLDKALLQALRRTNNPLYERVQSLNRIDRDINLNRRKGLRTLKKLSDFVDIDHTIIGDHVCSPKLGDDLSAVIFLISKPDDFAGRKLLRNTWAKSFLSSRQSLIKLYFVVGSPKNVSSRAAIQSGLELEQAAHYDLIQFGSFDGYYELNIKSVAILRWISFYCPLVRVVLKSDMDSYVDYDLFVQHCHSLIDDKVGSRHFEIHGTLNLDARVLRSTRNKWFTKAADFPARTYPLYASSSWLLAGPGLSFLLYRTALLHSLPALLWEDVWISAIVAGKLSDKGVPVKLVDCVGCLNYYDGRMKPFHTLWLIMQIPQGEHNQSHYLKDLFEGSFFSFQ